MKDEHNLTGKDFNDWHVIKLSEYRSKSDRDRYWHCRCKCGLEKPVKACYLKSGQSKRCIRCAHDLHKKLGRKIPLGYWDSLVRNASKRGIDFQITQDDVFGVFEKQNHLCALSSLPIVFAETATDHNNGKTTASVDRIDPNDGYCVDNIQLVHKKVNFMKHTLNQSEFISLCEAVVRNFDHHVDGKRQS